MFFGKTLTRSLFWPSIRVDFCIESIILCALKPEMHCNKYTNSMVALASPLLGHMLCNRNALNGCHCTMLLFTWLAMNARPYLPSKLLLLCETNREITECKRHRNTLQMNRSAAAPRGNFEVTSLHNGSHFSAFWKQTVARSILLEACFGLLYINAHNFTSCDDKNVQHLEFLVTLMCEA